MCSMVGSYLKPPERIFVPAFTQNNESSQNHYSVNFEITSPKKLHSPNSQGNVNNIKSFLKLGEWYKVCYIKLQFYVANNVFVYLILIKLLKVSINLNKFSNIYCFGFFSYKMMHHSFIIKTSLENRKVVEE